MTREAPTTVSVEDAGALLGVSRTTAYRLVALGEFPVRVLRVGRKLRVPTALLADALGLGTEEVLELIDSPVARPGSVAKFDSEPSGAPIRAP
jgi:excisionase family DNA binding protein